MRDIQTSLEEYYKKRRADFEDESQFVGWKNQEAQRVRFEQLLKVVDKRQPFSMNDVGCGLGHLVEYLQENDFQFSYTGYDTLSEMVEAAKKQYGNLPRVSFKQVTEQDGLLDADYSVASGIFNLKYAATETEWVEYILRTINSMHMQSRNGFAFNALTKYSDSEYMKPELYYADPLFLFDYCKRHLSKNVALLHDYGFYDFTIIVRK